MHSPLPISLPLDRGGRERNGKTGRVQRALAHANWLI